MSTARENENNSQTWLGTSMFDIYNGKDPWCFHVPPILPSKYHHVLYQLPVTLQNAPKPHYSSQPKHWDDDYVRMPYSQNSLFHVKENGEEITKPRWSVIRKALSYPINSSKDLESAINSYNDNLPKFTALHHFFNEVLDEEETQYFFDNILPGIINLALELPELIPVGLPLLKRYHCRSVSLSQLQIACLLANSFLCTFLWRKDMAITYKSANFIRLFTAHDRLQRQSSVSEKLKCICHYFRRILSKNPVGCITFERKYIPKNGVPRWDSVDNNVGNTRIHITSDGTIEDGLGLLQVDFANKNIGGGVLGYGCVQEEIRFVICPELIISRLFIEQLCDTEAVTITGVERYSNYSGYGDTFKWAGNVQDETPFDAYGRKRTSITVIDATHFNKISDQFHPSAILRELNKAYVGFSSRIAQNIPPIATGNWGCGAFNGDLHLKSIIQLMACSATNRDLVYYSFGNEELKNEFHKFHLFLASNKITICQLWRFLCRFCASGLSQDKLYSFIQQCHFDSRTQPLIKHFFSSSNTKRDLSVACTSSSSTNEKEIVIEADDYKKFEGFHEEPSAVKVKKQLSNKFLKRSSSDDDIIKLIDIIDGNKNRPQESGENCSLLSEIDKLNKKANVSKSNEEMSKSESNVIDILDDEEEMMEVEEIVENVSKSDSKRDDKKTKITDYFSKTSK